MPLPDRLLTSLAVRLNGRIYLFDAGEGTQLGWKRAQLALRGFKLLAVTHLHADHCLGVPGLLMLRAQMDDPEPFTILGPPGIRSFLEETRKGLGFYLNYPIHFIEWSETSESLAYEDDQVRMVDKPNRVAVLCGQVSQARSRVEAELADAIRIVKRGASHSKDADSSPEDGAFLVVARPIDKRDCDAESGYGEAVACGSRLKDHVGFNLRRQC